MANPPKLNINCGIITYWNAARASIDKEELERRIATDPKIHKYKEEIKKLDLEYVEVCRLARLNRPNLSKEWTELRELKKLRAEIQRKIESVLRRMHRYAKPSRQDGQKVRYWMNMIKKRKPAIRTQLCREFVMAKRAEWQATWIKKGAVLPSPQETPPPDQEQKALTNEPHQG